MKQFRIYTEDKNREEIQEETAVCFANFTIYLVEGCYQGQSEQSLVIEIITDEKEYPLVKTLAESIKHLNNQQAVCLTIQDIGVTTI